MKQPPRRRSAWALSRWACGVTLTFHSVGASAEPAPPAEPVIFVQSTAASVIAHRSFARIRDELSTDRFLVIDAGGNPSAVIDRMARDSEASTILALFGDPETGHAELCVVARAGQRAAVHRAIVQADDPERMPEMLSMRALELLRATALELSIDSQKRSRDRSPQAATEISAAPVSPLPKAESFPFAIDTGIGMLGSLDGPPPSLIPVVRLRLRLATSVHTRVTVGGWGSRAHLDAATGSATISQGLALGELVLVFRADKRVRPMLSVGFGMLAVSVAGTGVAPYEGRQPQQWSAALDGGLGLAFGILPRAALVTELHAMLASPPVAVRFADRRVAHIGYPSFVFTLALQVSL